LRDVQGRKKKIKISIRPVDGVGKNAGGFIAGIFVQALVDNRAGSSRGCPQARHHQQGGLRASPQANAERAQSWVGVVRARRGGRAGGDGERRNVSGERRCSTRQMNLVWTVWTRLPRTQSCLRPSASSRPELAGGESLRPDRLEELDVYRGRGTSPRSWGRRFPSLPALFPRVVERRFPRA